MRYACLIYFDPRTVFNQSPEAEDVLRDSMDPQNAIRTSGHVVSEAPLTLPNEAVTLKVRNGKMSATDGPFLETKEMLGGIVVIDAGDLNEAVRIGATIPLARLGSVEVRPFVDFTRPRPRL